jgi:hypothetical protein
VYVAFPREGLGHKQDCFENWSMWFAKLAPRQVQLPALSRVLQPVMFLVHLLAMLPATSPALTRAEHLTIPPLVVRQQRLGARLSVSPSARPSTSPSVGLIATPSVVPSASPSRVRPPVLFLLLRTDAGPSAFPSGTPSASPSNSSLNIGSTTGPVHIPFHT